MNDKKAKEERENRKRNNVGKMLAITSGEETAPAKSTRSASKDQKKPLAITAAGEESQPRSKKRDVPKPPKRGRSLVPEKKPEKANGPSKVSKQSSSAALNSQAEQRTQSQNARKTSNQDVVITNRKLTHKKPSSNLIEQDK